MLEFRVRQEWLLQHLGLNRLLWLRDEIDGRFTIDRGSMAITSARSRGAGDLDPLGGWRKLGRSSAPARRASSSQRSSPRDLILTADAVVVAVEVGPRRQVERVRAMIWGDGRA